MDIEETIKEIGSMVRLGSFIGFFVILIAGFLIGIEDSATGIKMILGALVIAIPGPWLTLITALWPKK